MDNTNQNYTDSQLPPVPDDMLPPTPPVVIEEISRSKRFWRKFGGDGFIVSVIVHTILIIIAVVWIVSLPPSEPPPEKFDSGAGGGNGGPKLSMSEVRVQPRNAKAMVKTPSKLVAKGAASSISLPDMPSINMSSLTTGSLLGAGSKGSGGGAGGGSGGGIGPGSGGAHKVSLFGSSGYGVAGLTGTFYDLKQSAKGGGGNGKNDGKYLENARKFAANWDEGFLARNFFQSPQKLSLQQMLIPLRHGNAGEAPAAFEAPNVAPSNWIVHYKGTVTVPFTGKFRFVGMADDWIVVRWNRKLALTSGYGNSMVASYNIPKNGKPPAGVGASFPYLDRPAMQSGPWISVSKGATCDIEIAMGETPGGEFCAILAFQKDDDKSPLYLFRVSKDPIPKEATDNSKGAIPQNVQLDGGGFIWTAAKATGARPRFR
ncbi:MAG: hypothetical protein LBV28_04585 [Puniceicoccales bacterium]|jgi:hypothetical protein|nr:hypothetical protein [Puniceicoccales bacterium]